MNVAPKYGSILSLKRTSLFSQVLAATVGLMSRALKNSDSVKVLIFASDLSLRSHSSASSFVLNPRFVVLLGEPFASLNRQVETQQPLALSL